MKVENNYFLLASWLLKATDEKSRIRIRIRDPDPYQNVTVPQHFLLNSYASA